MAARARARLQPAAPRRRRDAARKATRHPSARPPWAPSPSPPSYARGVASPPPKAGGGRRRGCWRWCGLQGRALGGAVPTRECPAPRQGAVASPSPARAVGLAGRRRPYAAQCAKRCRRTSQPATRSVGNKVPWRSAKMRRPCVAHSALAPSQRYDRGASTH
eukprot:scaffold5857_cov403-Prasinococcus_capsulatus_cf.AAC.1